METSLREVLRGIDFSCESRYIQISEVSKGVARDVVSKDVVSKGGLA